MTVVPLVLALVMVGVNTATDAAASGRTARRAIVVFLVILPRRPRRSPRWSRRSAARRWCRATRPRRRSRQRAAVVDRAGGTAPPGRRRLAGDIVPTNAIAAAAQSAMLPLVVFALFLGFAADPHRRRARRARCSSFSRRSPTR